MTLAQNGGKGAYGTGKMLENGGWFLFFFLDNLLLYANFI
jgi:hypothetical protein